MALVADMDVEESAFEPRSCLQPPGGRQSYRAGNTNVDGDVEVVEFEIDWVTPAPMKEFIPGPAPSWTMRPEALEQLETSNKEVESA